MFAAAPVLRAEHLALDSHLEGSSQGSLPLPLSALITLVTSNPDKITSAFNAGISFDDNIKGIYSFFIIHDIFTT